MKTTSIVRDRGQLTIPDSVRESLSWLYPLAAVDITVCDEYTITLSPHAHRHQSSWDECIQKIELAQTFPSHSSRSASDIINEDRKR